MSAIAVKGWLARPFVLVCFAGVFLIAALTVFLDVLLDWQVDKSIRRNAEIRAITWSDQFFRTVPNAGQMFEKGAIAPQDVQRFLESFAMVDTLKFVLFDPDGKETFVSGVGPTFHDNEVNKHALSVQQTGRTIIHIHDTDEADSGPEDIVEAYIPAISPTGQRFGAIEVYVDVSDLEDALEDAFTQVSWFLIAGTLLVMAVPAAAYVHRSRQLRRRDRELLELTRYDQLTGILNRNSVSELLDDLFADRRTRSGLGILFVDVDHFKQVNDQYGHACGDKLLKHIARILESSVRSDEDTVARYGGDEFVILCRNITLADFRSLYGRVMEGARTPCEHETKTYVPSLSVGAYLTSADDDQKPALHRADLAVYAAKRRGRGQVVEYSHGLEGMFEQDAARQTA